MQNPLSIPARPVPPYSQLRDVSDPDWQLRSCGIATLKMMMEYLAPEKNLPSIDDLILDGTMLGAYKEERGWTHNGLARLAEANGFTARDYDWTALPLEDAFTYFFACLAESPLIASVDKEFSPSKDGHLVVVTGISGNTVSVNDPYRSTDEEMVYVVPLSFFLHHWTKRMILIQAAGGRMRPRYASWLDILPQQQ